PRTPTPGTLARTRLALLRGCSRAGRNSRANTPSPRPTPTPQPPLRDGRFEGVDPPADSGSSPSSPSGGSGRQSAPVPARERLAPRENWSGTRALCSKRQPHDRDSRATPTSASELLPAGPIAERGSGSRFKCVTKQVVQPARWRWILLGSDARDR